MNKMNRADDIEHRLTKDLLDISPAFVGFIDPETGHLLHANDRALDTINAFPEDVIGKVFWECPWWKKNPESARAIREGFEEANNGVCSKFDLQYWVSNETPEGEIRWVSFRMVPMFNGRECNRIGVSGIDITEYKHTEIRLKETERKYRLEKDKLETIFTESPAAMAIWRGEELVFEKVNTTYQAIFANRQLLGRRIEEAIPEAVEQGFPAILRKVFQTNEPFIGAEQSCFINVEGQDALVERFYDFTFIRINDGEGRPYGVFAHAIDVTEKVRSRRTNENNSLLLSTVLSSIPAPIAVFDTNESYKFVNRYVLDKFGINEDVILGKTVKEVAGNEVYNTHLMHIQDALAGKSSKTTLDFDLFGKKVSYEISFNPGFGSDGQVNKVVAMAWDRSAEVELANVLRAAKDAAEAASVSKSAFLANMSHEIRTPLGAIMGFSDLASQVGTSKKDLDSYLSIINRSSEQVLRIIDDILDLSKVEAGKMNIEKISISLTEFLADFSSLMGFRAKENGINYTTCARTDLPERVITDPTRLRQILTNSVGNAIKFTGQGEVKLHVSYVDGELQFLVMDTGRGISPEQAEILFQPFTQADSSMTRKFGGTGLGLVVTRGLCSIMGGNYSLVKSRLGEGSQFLATVKVEVPSDVQIIPANKVVFETLVPSSVPLSLHQLKNLKILLVEDSPDNQRLLKILLTQQGAEMEMANDGLEGMEKALQDSFDIVLMDIQMPRMDGHGAARRLRSQGYKKPIIALTAHAMKEEAEKAARSGFSGYVTKPVQKQELISTILAAGRA